MGVAFTAKATSFSYVTRAGDKADKFSDLSDSEHVEYRNRNPHVFMLRYVIITSIEKGTPSYNDAF